MRHVRTVLVVALGLSVTPALADVTEFTADATISCNDISFDGDTVIVDSCMLTVHCEHVFQRLEVRHYGVITHAYDDTLGLTLHILGDLLVDSTSRLDAAMRGYAESIGPGAGEIDIYCGGGGGGHGGRGGHGGNVTICGGRGGCWYDSPIFPTLFGSGGAWGYWSNGGRGGGLIRLTVDGSLTIDGIVTTDAQNGTGENGGAGAGGSIVLQAGTIGGSGEIVARGGNSPYGMEQYTGGSGGGGCIAVFYCAGDPDSLTVSANAGVAVGEATSGENGSVYIGNADCNGNSVPDGCEIAFGSETDCNENGVLDVCESLNGPRLLVYFTCTRELLLKWSCLEGWPLYRVYGNPDFGPEQMLATTSHHTLDITSLIDTPYTNWDFHVVGFDSTR